MSSTTVRGDALYAVVATTRFVLLVNLQTKDVIPLESHRPEYYGVSWLPGGPELVLSHSGSDNAALVDLPTLALSETGFLSRGETETAPFLSQPHQILCGSDGRVICTNSGRNAISVVNPDKPGVFQEARISAARWDRLSLSDAPGDHLNSVFEKDGLLYVIAHGHKKGSKLATLSYPDLQTVAVEPVPGRAGLHNIWVTDDGRKISCYSEMGALIDLSSEEILWESGSPIYTRGLAACADFVLVGESQKIGRDLRHSSVSGLWLLDRKTWQTLDYFHLGPFGGVHEVRLLNVADEAHHGHPFADVSALIKKDLRNAMREERLATAGFARINRHAWAVFELVFGAALYVENGGRKAVAESLCLLVHRSLMSENGRRMSFAYSLDLEPGRSHVSAVIYRGKGGDSDMHALLIEPMDTKQAHLSLWLHDGDSWKVQPGIDVRGLPLAAEVELRSGTTELELFVDGARLVGLPLDKFSSDRLGIRWAGATIYPRSGSI